MKPGSLIAIFLLIHRSAMACVGCREPGVGGMEEPQTVLAGVAFSWGVIVMLAIVASLVSGLGYYIAKTCQRVDRENGTQ